MSGARVTWAPGARLLLAGSLLGLATLAWTRRNVVDDAFIYFRYAENLTRGHGLVWNPGEYVDGATAFLWTLLLGGAMALGFEPVSTAFALGITCFLGALVLFAGIARRTLASPWWACVAVVLLGSNFSFSASATEGLGTHLQTLVLLGCVRLFLVICEDRSAVGWPLVALSLLAALAVVVRMDSVLPLAVVMAGSMAVTTSRAPAGVLIARLLGPGGTLLALWCAWRWRYYGEVPPNTFYLKAIGVSATTAGLYYLYAFALSYLLPAHLLLAGAMVAREGRRTPPVVALSTGMCAVWCAYLVWIGGDFIEFRFLVPILPYLVLLVCWAVLTAVAEPGPRIALLAALAVGSLHHEWTFGRVIFPNAMYRPSLKPLAAAAAASAEAVLWAERESGDHLREAFGSEKPVRIAVGAAGIIPYRAKLPAVDLMGLTDRWVARHGSPLRFDQFIGGLYPAHVRMATLDYLLAREVDLLLGAGALTRQDVVRGIRSRADLLTAMFLGDAALAAQTGMRDAEFPPHARVVEIPVRPGYVLLSIGLTEHPGVAGTIATRGWRTYPLADLDT